MSPSLSLRGEKSNPELQCIQVRGARTHNLKNVDIDIPRGKLVVVTGVSGSGKSSFAIDTLFAEAQRQYLESLSSFARQFVDKMERPNVDAIFGLQPSLCIDQQQGSLSPRSTVGTVTEIYDYLRLLMARCATPACHKCGQPIDRQSADSILEQIRKFPSETRIGILAPMVIGRKGAHADVFERIAKAGLLKARVDGELIDIDTPPTLALRKEHTISAVVDRLVLRSENDARLEQSVHSALRLSQGLVEIVTFPRDNESSQEFLFSTRYACVACGVNIAEIEPRTFSFNSPYGACPKCEGFGVSPKESKTPCPSCHGARLRNESLAIRLEKNNVHDMVEMPIDQFATWLTSIELKGNKATIAEPLIREICSRIHFLKDVGLGYLSLGRSAESLSGGELQRVKLASSLGAGLTGVCYVLDEPSVGLHPSDTEMLIESLTKLRDRGNTVLVVEHDHEIMRAADWIVDFGPTAGLNGGRLLVEAPPSELTQPKADSKYSESVTVRYLSGAIPPPGSRNRPTVASSPSIKVRDIKLHNLQGVSCKLPLNRLVGILGVSGSGKSTLIQDSVVPAIHAKLSNEHAEPPGHVGGIDGLEQISRLIVVDQSPIGRSPRSTPATYCGFWDDIRKVYAATRDAKQRGFDSSFFSFNSGKGRCESCAGQGRVKLEMNFLADVYIMCPQCRGNRFQRSVLAVRFKGKSIADILNMSILEAADFFSEIPKLNRPLQGLVQVGLGYMPIGQPATTISGGEAQRIKLAAELSKTNSGQTAYFLDEPTSGLHTQDVHRLIDVLQNLVDQGNSVFVIEHHWDVIRACDWIIEMGPGAASNGGKIVYAGPPGGRNL
ncbi:MAG: ABC-ATPase UvrA [Pirellula sp.]|jgi:excinuclease ABC subunit A|nr:ABC-ATPase UvrA [Pirellula sp.]